jgi:hypothetical protein
MILCQSHGEKFFMIGLTGYSSAVIKFKAPENRAKDYSAAGWACVSVRRGGDVGSDEFVAVSPFHSSISTSEERGQK